MGKHLARFAVIGFGLGLAIAASLPFPQVAARAPDLVDATRSRVGSYLAGRFARSSQDSGAAAEFYGAALARDPGDVILLEQAFQMETMDGNWPRAIEFAQGLVTKEPGHRMARLLLGIDSFRASNFKKADEHFAAAAENPIGELTSALARGWTKLAAQDANGAMAAVEMPRQPDWAQFYLRYHRALIADIAGKRAEAKAAYERMYVQDSRTLRTALAYARHAAHWGDTKTARAILKDQLEKGQGEGHPLARDLLAALDANQKIDFIVQTPVEGLAEVFYGLGEALAGEGGVSLGTTYLQLALAAKPDHTFALAALASALESARRFDAAIDTYNKIPRGTPLDTAIEIRKAFNLNSLEKVDEAKVLLEKLAAKDPKDLRPLEALGNIMRSHKRYSEAVSYYTRAIDILGKPDKRHWTYYYSRGTSYERLKNWPAAEVDLQKALKLSPDQPLVLNYLGYSWIDQNKNLKKGMALIEKAVALKPDDGYIVDSLGWAHYKLGNFKEAVRYLERAVEIRPDDATLNDHLGDALWRIGREREARFQWSQALSLNPEPEEASKMKLKLEAGLPPDAKPKTREASRVVSSRRRSENRATAPSSPSIE